MGSNGEFVMQMEARLALSMTRLMKSWGFWEAYQLRRLLRSFLRGSMPSKWRVVRMPRQASETGECSMNKDFQTWSACSCLEALQNFSSGISIWREASLTR